MAVILIMAEMAVILIMAELAAILIMAELAVILRGLATSNEGDPYVDMVCNLLLHHRELILNKFRIYNIWHIRRRKPCQLPG